MSKKISSNRTEGIVLIACCIFLLIIDIYGLYLGVRGITLAEKSLMWPSIVGETIESKISRIPDTSYYSPKVKYRYRVDNKTFIGDTIWFGFSHFSKKNAEAIIAKYSIGRPIDVFYDPSAPNISCLKPGKQHTPNLFLILCGFFGILDIFILSIVLREFTKR